MKMCVYVQLDEDDITEVIIRDFADFDVDTKTYRVTKRYNLNGNESDGSDDEAADGLNVRSATRRDKRNKMMRHRYLHLGIESALLGKSPGML